MRMVVLHYTAVLLVRRHAAGPCAGFVMRPVSALNGGPALSGEKSQPVFL